MNLKARMAAVADVLAEERARRDAILTVLRLFPGASDSEIAAEVSQLGHRKPSVKMVAIMREPSS